MISFIEIINRIKEVLDTQKDNIVAEALGMKATTLALRKKRGSIPYEEIFTFCNGKKISMDWILTAKGPKTQKERDLLYKIESSGIREIEEIYKTTKEAMDDIVGPPGDIARKLEEQIVSYFPYMTNGQKEDFLADIKHRLLSELIKRRAEEERIAYKKKLKPERRKKHTSCPGDDKRK